MSTSSGDLIGAPSLGPAGRSLAGLAVANRGLPPTLDLPGGAIALSGRLRTAARAAHGRIRIVLRGGSTRQDGRRDEGVTHCNHA
jgi:hypothetical protein